ncbi:hypothetical protein FOA52_015079 [Chlamydomonas sp. UWO 241]|nr:hypothetical protein FOA52_015079 [Chlamydomonas sp. UWO 241]
MAGLKRSAAEMQAGGSGGGGGGAWDDALWSKSFTWRIENFSKLTSEPLIQLSALKAETGGWLVNNTLVVKVDVTVEREDRFHVNTGGMPCDATLKLPCRAKVPVLRQLLQVASPFFRGALEDVKYGVAVPVDGSLGTWTYILSCLYPLHDQPDLTLLSVYTLLPVVHKYDFTKLLGRLVAIVMGKREELSADPGSFSRYVIRWLALAERLQLDKLRELCLDKLRSFKKEQLKLAFTVEVEVDSDTEQRLLLSFQKNLAVREEVKSLSQAL